MPIKRVICWIAIAFVVVSQVQLASRRQATPQAVGASNPSTEPSAVITSYCITCHNQKLRTSGLALDSLDLSKPSENAEVLERVIVRLRARSMPPAGMPRPDAATYRATANELENQIDRA